MNTPSTDLDEPAGTALSDRLASNLKRVLVAFAIVSIVLAIFNIALDSDTEASQEPAAAVFDTRELIDDRLSPVTHRQFIIVEHPDGGDMLTAASLGELRNNSEALRRADVAGELAPDDVEAQPLLADRWDSDAQARVQGFTTIADAVERYLSASGSTLATATDDEVKIALHDLFNNPATTKLRGQISVQGTETSETINGRAITVYRSPAVFFPVDAHNEPLGGGTFQIGPSSDPVVKTKEAFNLNVESQLRTNEQHTSTLAVAAAANETAAAQGQTAAPFIVLAVVAAVLIVGIALRSYWAAALTGAGLAIQMTWLGGLSDVIGLKGGLVIDLLVPISMIALGVDFAVHSMANVDHERTKPRIGRRAGIGGVLIALALAAATDSAAFLSNATSSIESIAHFGIAAALATISSFIVLGIVAPLVYAHITETLGSQANNMGRFSKSPVFGSIRAAIMAGAASIVTLAISPVIGIAMAVAVVAVNLVAPWRYANRNLDEFAVATAPRQEPRAARVTALAARAAERPVLVLAGTAVVTGIALVGALGLNSSFEISDFFSGDTDFVQSVDRLPAHLGDRGGEANQILISGSLEEPKAWEEIGTFIDSLADNDALATTLDGTVDLREPQPHAILQQAVVNGETIAARTGVSITDTDANGLPDTAAQIRAVWADAMSHGVDTVDGTQQFTPAEIGGIVSFDDSAGPDLALLGVQVPEPSNLDGIKRAGEQIVADGDRLTESDLISSVDPTGSGLGRLEVIGASTDALKTSLPVAVLAVFAVLLLGLRSLRLAIVSTIPMLLVATWLYGVMALLNIDLNLVTATVGAISIGIGADYAIHMTDRYRRERELVNNHLIATRAATESTGSALVTSAVSTAVAFGVLALAPMPLFATFGLLSALMVLFALLASLLVLPAMLNLVSPPMATVEQTTTAAAVTTA